TEIVLGRYLNDTDLDTASDVAVVGWDIVDNVLTGSDPIGQEILVNGRLYTVVGVGKKQGKTLGMSRGNYVVLPITSWLRQFGSHRSIRISAKATNVGPALEAALDETRIILRARRHDQPGQPDSFAEATNESFLSIWANIS